MLPAGLDEVAEVEGAVPVEGAGGGWSAEGGQPGGESPGATG